MEWLPIRYLLIPTTFLFPILGKTLYEISTFTISFMKNNKDIWHKFLLLTTVGFLLIIGKAEYTSSLLKTKNQLTILSFLSLEKEEDMSLSRYSKMRSFEEVKEFIKSHHFDGYIEYYFSDKERSWQDQALFYFTNLDGTDLSKDQFAQKHNKENLIVWEREPSQREEFWDQNLQLIFINQNYYVATD